MNNKKDKFTEIWHEVNDSFNKSRDYPELNSLSYYLADFRDELGEIIDELEVQGEDEE